MKKIIILFITFFKILSIYGQETKIEISNFFRESSFNDRNCNDEIRVTAFYETNNGSIDSELIILYEKEFEIGSDRDRTYTVPGILTKIEIYQFARDAEDKVTRKSCSSGDGTTVEDTRIIGTVLNPCSQGFFLNPLGGREVSAQVQFNYKITPLPKPERVNELQTDIGFEDDLTLTATEGLRANVYNWQYGFFTGFSTIIFGTLEIPIPQYEWFELPVTSQREPTINLSDFLDESVLGKQIFFRIRPCDGFGSDVISYNVKKSAPHIQSAVGSTTTCYNDEDGVVTITFDSPIDLINDELGIRISDPSRQESNAIEGTRAFVVASYTNDDLLDFINDNSRVLIIPNLPPTRGADFIVSYDADPETYFSDSEEHSATFKIDRLDPVEFNGELETAPVFCFGGNDGTITVQGQGGTGSFEYSFDNTDNNGNELPNEGMDVWTRFSTPSRSEHIITGLTTGNYTIKIRDTKGCVAKLQSENLDLDTGDIILLAEDDVRSIFVEEPKAPLSLTYVEENIIEPTAFGFEDGQIQVVIEGGTQFDPTTDPLYTVTWKNASGETLTDVRSEVVNSGGDNVYRVTLFNIPTGTYFVEVTDANHFAATYKNTCYVNSSRALSQPDPLEIILSIENDISCHIENEYSDGVDFIIPLGIMDQFQDGVIVAQVKGGVIFDEDSELDTTDCREGKLPYCFHWTKKINNVWVDIDVNNDTIIDQSFGDYALNVTDKNGIVIGDYNLIKNAAGENEYVLSQENDVEIYLPQPDKLEIEFDKTAVLCNDGNNAETEVLVTGGTPPYEYSWSTGATTSKIENLSAGFYLVSVLDAKGCRIDGKVEIEQPNGLAINIITEKSPTCFEGNDGVIEVNITGGVSPYTLSWNTGETSENLRNLTEGLYSLSVEDFQGCQIFLDVTLIDPEEIIVDLGENRTLCDNQSLVLDMGIEDAGATYLWTSTNGYNSTQSSVELTEQGTYKATLTTRLGCIGVGVVEVTVLDTLIDSDFLITTQAYVGEEVILVNVSEPKGIVNEWSIPENVEVIEETDDKLTMLFAEEGPYDISLRAYQGDCYQDFTKTIVVQPAPEIPVFDNGSQQLIEEFICFPNPSNGEFQTKIALTENSNITLKLLDITTGAVLAEGSDFNKQDFLLDFNMLSLAKGLYFMLLETPKGSETRKVIIE